MCHKNRMLDTEICMDGSDDSDGSDGSADEEEGLDGNQQENANVTASKSFPLAHRCLSATDFRYSS